MIRGEVDIFPATDDSLTCFFFLIFSLYRDKNLKGEIYANK